MQKNIKHHERSCDKNPNRHNETTSRQPNVYNNIQLIQSTYDNAMAVYRRTVSSEEDVFIAFQTDVPTFLQREVRERLYFKWYTALKVVFVKAIDPDVTTDPPICFRTSPRLGLSSTDYKNHSEQDYHYLTEQIETFTKNGSGWIIDHYVELDISIINIKNPCGEWSDSE